MSLYENFPYTNLHNLNLDWIIKTLNELKESQVLSVNGMTGDVILYQNATMQLPTVEDDHWSIIRMADGTQRGIMFANDGTAYIVHGNTMSQVYSVNNQPPYPVTRVNGKTGDITLYSEQYVQLPSLSDAQMTSWTFFRTLNNVSRGIQFNDDGTADIINGNSRYRILDSNNTPALVSSVNGSSGAVVLFTDVNGMITFPTDTSVGGLAFKRTVQNNTEVAIGITEDGTVQIQVGNDIYPVYTGLNPGWINDPEDDTIIINTEAGTPDWGFIRETTEGYVGILFSNDPDLAEPAAYVQYIDSNDQVQTLKLLTSADIPTGQGVFSVNGMDGIVVVTGADINITSNSSYSVYTVAQRFRNSFARTYTNGLVYDIGDYISYSYILYKAIDNTGSGNTWTAADWQQVAITDDIKQNTNNINSILSLFAGVQTVQKQVSTATTYTCAEASGEWYTISDLNYTTTGKCLVIINAHLKVTSSKDNIQYYLSQSLNRSITVGTAHYINGCYAQVYNANVTPSFEIRLEDGDSITYGGADLREAGITYTIIPLE